MTMNKWVYIGAGIVALWAMRQRARQGAGCGCTAAQTIESGIPTTGDIGGNWWTALHGNGQQATTANSTGVSPDPGRLGISSMFGGGQYLDWDGSIRVAPAR